MPLHDSPRFARRVFSSTALVAFGVGAALIVIEIVLQLGALYVRVTGRETAAGWLTGGVRVLCAGDSNTYGYLVEPAEAYPKVLEREWNGRGGRRPIEVLNVGYPGMNSSELRKSLPRFLSMFQPDVMTVMVGTNDFWTKPATDSGTLGWWQRLQLSLYRRSRTYRLLHMVRRALQQPTLEVSNAQPTTNLEEIQQLRGEDWLPAVQRILKERGEEGERFRGEGVIRYGGDTIEIEWGKNEGGTENWKADLAKNIAAIAAMTRATGVKLILITYPSGNGTYGTVNELLRRIAPEIGVPLIDVEAVTAPRCPRWRCAELLPDQHPSAQGHALTASVLMERLSELPGL